MKVFTTQQVAKICKVAPRTVHKWFDSGRLKGYRLPGSQERRIPEEYLRRFLNDHGLPMNPLDEFLKAQVKPLPAHSYVSGWRPEANLQESALKMLTIIFDPQSSSRDCEMAATTLVEAVYPELLSKVTAEAEAAWAAGS